MVKLMSYRSISSQVLTEEAQKLWLEVEIINREKNLFLVKSKDKEVLFKSTDCGLNSSLGLKIANDKELTYNMLERANLPVAHTKYVTIDDISDDFDDSGFTYPLVIKPLDGSQWKWVVMNIQNISGLLLELKNSLQENATMIIQDQIIGDEYRFLIMNWEIVVIFRRAYPIVTWDGKSSIQQLIAIENETNPYRWEWYNKPIAYIQVDDECKKTLNTQWYDLNSVPELGHVVKVRSNSNLWTGWTVVDVTETMSQEYKEVAIKAAESCGLWLAWVDIIINDITSSNESLITILEVWATPWLWWQRDLTNTNAPKVMLMKLFGISYI